MQNRTKIVATVGPASARRETLARLLDAGVDVFRLNLAHGDREEHAATVDRIRDVEAEAGRPVAILMDLAGPKIRVGALPGGRIELREGEEVLVTGPAEAAAGRIPVTYASLPREVSKGERILLDDGRIELSVTAPGKRETRARVVAGGVLEEGKGVNLPDTTIALPSLAEKDLADLDLVAEKGADLVGLSFVRSVDDLRALRAELARRGASPLVVAKIETAPAAREFGPIVEEADAVMVARGDLGVEVGVERVPVLQKQIISTCNAAGKPVITATEMLESMRSASRPTRAEASDVANAVLDGTDAVMLSGETSVGEHPVRVVQTMERILEEIESHTTYGWPTRTQRSPRRSGPEEGIATAAAEAAWSTQAKAVAAFTRSGATAARIAAWRPGMTVFALAPDERVRRRLVLHFGVTPLAVDPVGSLEEALAAAESALLATGRFEEGDRVVVVAGLSDAEEEAPVLVLHRLSRSRPWGADGGAMRSS